MQIHRKLWKNYTKVNFITVINQGAPLPVWKRSKKRRGATMSPLRSKIYKRRRHGKMRSEKHSQKRSWGKRCRSRCRHEWKPATRRSGKKTRTGAPGKLLFYSSNLHFSQLVSWKEKLLLFRLFDLFVLGSYHDLQKNNQTFCEFLSPNLRYSLLLTKQNLF